MYVNNRTNSFVKDGVLFLQAREGLSGMFARFCWVLFRVLWVQECGMWVQVREEVSGQARGFQVVFFCRFRAALPI